MKHFISGFMKLTIVSVLVVFLVACGGAEERKVKYLEKGKAYLEEKNYDKAKIEFKNVLQIDPKFADAYFYMGQLEEKNKELKKALGNYKKAIELNPEYTLAQIKLSKIYVIAGTKELIDQAKELLSLAKKKQPDNIEAKLILATIEYKTGSKLKARKDIELIVEEDKNLVEGVSLLSSLYLFEGNESKAISVLEKGVKDNSKSVSLRIALAKLLAKNNKLEEAISYLKESIVLEPEKYALKIALSSFYVSSNQVDKAESVLREAIEQDDDDVQRYLVLVEMLSSRVSLKKGDEELQAAIRNKPELHGLKFAQVKFYEKTGKREKAKAVLKEIITNRAYEVEGLNARNQLAKYLLEEGDQKGAKKHVDEVMAEHPNNNDALLISSKLALMNLDAITAINGLRTIVKNAPKNAEASLLLAQAHEINKESALAENELKKSIEVNPVNDQVHVNYARYLASKGRIDEAVDVVDKAQAYFKDSYDLMEVKLKILASQGKETETLALLDLMEQSNASKSEVNINKGQYYLSKGKIDKAIEQFEKAYIKSQDKFKPLQLIVKAYAMNGSPEKALQRLQSRLKKNPDDVIAILLTGQVYLVQKKIEAARAKFIRASEIAESWLIPYSNLAATYLAENDLVKAMSVYQKAVTKLKNKSAVQMKIAAIYEKQKKYSDAMGVYENILEVSASHMLAANNYASLLLDYGSDADALKALDLSKKFEKLQQPALQDTLAWANAKTGNSAKAIEILRPIVEKAPKIAVFRYHLGYALYHMDDKAAAKSHLEIASSSDQKFPGKDKATELLKSI